FKRDNLNKERELWTNIIEKTPITCLYSNKRIQPNNFELDHFIPWSFVCHNQPWNLTPVLPEINSSKSNCLPHTKYISPFIHQQTLFLKESRDLLSPPQWHKLIEPYVVSLKIEETALLNEKTVKKALLNTLRPLIFLAQQAGFQSQWVYKQPQGEFRKIS
ncbi:MAG: hypothetical protein D6797_01175, partial [Bdellovibrio sp.]